MDSFTLHTAELVSKALRSGGHVEGSDENGRSGFKITASGTPGTIRLSYGMWVNPHYSDLALIKRQKPARQLEHLGRYTLDLLSTFTVHLVSSDRARYLLVSQHTIRETNEIRAMMVRAALMDLPEGYRVSLEESDPDTMRVTFSPEVKGTEEISHLARMTGNALREAQTLLKAQGWEVVEHIYHGFLFVWEKPFQDVEL
jgi:hypothetical protein